MKLARQYWLIAIMSNLCLSTAALAQWTPPNWTIERIGLYDAPHTFSSGLHRSRISGYTTSGLVIGQSQQDPSGNASTLWAWSKGMGTVTLGLVDPLDPQRPPVGDLVGVNEAGQVVGVSRLHVSGGVGNAAWLWTAGNDLLRLGYLDAAHTGPGGLQSTQPTFLNEQGVVVGFSLRFDGTSEGASAWRWTQGTGLTRLGFTNSEHTGPGGTQYSETQRVRDSGLIDGISRRYVAGAQAGQSAWVWSESLGLRRMGITDSQHTGLNGAQNSSIAVTWPLTDLVVGSSSQYLGNDEAGGTAWAWSVQDGTVRIGLYDADHTGPNGERVSWPGGAAAGGRVAGGATRFLTTPEAFFGRSAWTWTRAEGTTRIGLVDAEHTSVDGLQVSDARAVTDDSVTGTSTRYIGQLEAGESAWVWMPGAGTTRLGFTDAAHTRADGTQNSWCGGQVGGVIAGTSVRYSGSSEAGYTSWVWTRNGGLVRIGFYDAEHTAANGRQSSYIEWGNASGKLVGESAQWNGNTAVGATGWVYDVATALTTPLVFSTRTDGSSSTFPWYIGDDGNVLGTYSLYDGDTLVSDNQFIWSPTQGLGDFTTFPSGGIQAYGIPHLSSAMLVGQGTVIGDINPDSAGSDGVLYAMTRGCPTDFNGDGTSTDADIEAFFACFSGNCCPTCGSADFNADGDSATDADIEAFFRVLAGGNC